MLSRQQPNGLTVCIDTSPRYNISEPFNFQHLTHTTPQQVAKIQKTGHGDLISEFSAIRAAQQPRRELRGIKARNIQQGTYFLGASASETSSPPRTGYSNSPPGSPSQDYLGTEPHSYDLSFSGKITARKASIENFSQPSPSYYTAQSSPTSPPLRSSSRSKTPDFFLSHHEPSEDTMLDHHQHLGSPDFPSDPWEDAIDDHIIPHAITTPDNTAHAVRSPFSMIRTELAGVPEEDEMSEGKRISITTSIMRPATPASSLRHAKSFPSTKSSPSRRSGTPSLDSNHIDERPSVPSIKTNFTAVPGVEEHTEEVPFRPRSSRRISLRKEESWEDVIDYCYEHEAEADCNFDWELASHPEGQADPVSITVAVPSDNVEENLGSPVEAQELIDSIPRRTTTPSRHPTPTPLPSAPPVPLATYPSEIQSPTADSVESSYSSISELVTPLPTDSAVTNLSRSNSNSKDWATHNQTPLIVPEDIGGDYTFDDFYHRMLASQAASNNQLLFSTGRVDGSTISNSPRSSHSPISKSNSQESFWHSQAGAAACRHRNTGSVGSLPDLVHSRSNDRSDNVNDPLVDQTALLSVSDVPAEGSHHQRRPSLAKDVALKSILSKVATSEAAEGTGTQSPLLHPAFRDRAFSDTPHSTPPAALPPLPQGPIPRRMRSPSSASSLAARTVNRASYSLFPVRGVR